MYGIELFASILNPRSWAGRRSASACARPDAQPCSNCRPGPTRCVLMTIVGGDEADAAEVDAPEIAFAASSHAARCGSGGRARSGWTCGPGRLSCYCKPRRPIP